MMRGTTTLEGVFKSFNPGAIRCWHCDKGVIALGERCYYCNEHYVEGKTYSRWTLGPRQWRKILTMTIHERAIHAAVVRLLGGVP